MTPSRPPWQTRDSTQSSTYQLYEATGSRGYTHHSETRAQAFYPCTHTGERGREEEREGIAAHQKCDINLRSPEPLSSQPSTTRRERYPLAYEVGLAACKQSSSYISGRAGLSSAFVYIHLSSEPENPWLLCACVRLVGWGRRSKLLCAQGLLRSDVLRGMSTQNARSIESLLGSEQGEEPSASEQQQQQQQLVDDATMQVAPEMNAGVSLLQAYGGVGDSLRREDGSHDEARLMHTRVGGQVTERRPWSRSEDEAIARMVGGGFMHIHTYRL